MSVGVLSFEQLRIAMFRLSADFPTLVGAAMVKTHPNSNLILLSKWGK